MESRREHGIVPNEAPPTSRIPLPDLSPFADDSTHRHAEHRFPFPGHERDLEGILAYEVMERGASIGVRLSAVGKNGELAMVFSGVIKDADRNSWSAGELCPASGSTRHARIFTRLVEPNYRNQGIGSASLRILEDVFARIGDANPESRPRWIQILTGLESTSNLIVDPNWLAEWLDANYGSLQYDALNRLLDRAGKTTLNLGYVPAPGFEAAGVATLTNGSTDLSNHASTTPDVLFYRKLDPTVAFKNPNEPL